MSLPADVEDALRRHRDEVERLLRQLSAEADVHAELCRAADAAVDLAYRDLADAALPSLDDDERLAAAAALWQVDAFQPAAVAALVRGRREALQRRVDEAAADARFPGATERLAVLERRARELLEPIAHLRESVRALEQDRDFRQFAASCDDERWWTFSYHRDRAAGARALARHGARRRVSDVSSLVKRHREEREALATLEGEVNAIAAERQRLRALVDEHARASAMLASVEQDALEELRDAYRSSARFLDDATLLPRFPEPPLRGLARRVSGVTTRTRYLSALFVHHNERPRGRLTTHLQDVSLVLREGASALRGGIGETAAEIERETERRRCEVEEQIRRYRSTAQRLMAFTRWDDCDPLAGQLWWDAFTGGLIDGSFIDEVAWHRTMGRPRGTALTGGVDRRDAWAANAESAMDALAAAHAEVLAAKRDRDHGDDDDGVDDGGDDGATVPAPVELPDDER